VITAQKGEIKLAYMLRRGGPDSILFIHGLGASKDSFKPCFELDSFKDYTLAAPDLPGCGESRWLDASYTMGYQADAVLQWITGMDLGPLTIVGHSMGGVIGIYLAEALGPQVTKFFNLEGNLTERDCIFSGKIASLSREAFEKRGLQQFKSTLEDLMLTDPSPGLKGYYKNISRCSPKALYLSALSLVNESRGSTLKERFLDLTAEKWYVFGERSVDPSTRRFLEYHHIPYFIVPNSGHFMMEDQPRLFYEMLLKAIQSKEQ
jgi:pimeloyl-ACP methyl ester carboxylesterase